MPLNVCICGWYFPDEWYAAMLRLKNQGVAEPFIVANREQPLLDISNLPYAVRENTGLEWGAYNYYLREVWKDGPVVFCHDDLKFAPVLRENKIVSGEELFEKLGMLEIDHGYVFSSREADVVNYGKHGRMLVMSPKLLEWCKKDEGGFWHDPQEGWPKDYNMGITRFDALMYKAQKTGFDVNNKIFYPGLEHGHRGEFKGRVI